MSSPLLTKQSLLESNIFKLKYSVPENQLEVDFVFQCTKETGTPRQIGRHRIAFRCLDNTSYAAIFLPP
ncbi:hypothetical protein PILCRDRAFT_814488 [Piloderma croceum F 1598]|uniref:Uncharacterized protein n=1 Tax=Piloderma croceum (strain F 1598) TaxID=765440 RepID=A0A0C3GAW2_PILCF|nr:hypothetical protein PILCRDRAFT_814488 [Piloderma croceum F 1598]